MFRSEFTGSQDNSHFNCLRVSDCSQQCLYHLTFVVFWIRYIPHRLRYLNTWFLAGGLFWDTMEAWGCVAKALGVNSLAPLPLHCLCFLYMVEMGSLGLLLWLPTTVPPTAVKNSLFGGISEWTLPEDTFLLMVFYHAKQQQPVPPS